jgi:hypothetical protein
MVLGDDASLKMMRRSTFKEIRILMKKLMSIMLGLSLLTGVVAFADDKGDDKKNEKKGSKKKGKKKEDKH